MNSPEWINVYEEGFNISKEGDIFSLMMKIFITGASSGIGEALAYAYSKRKCIVLSARRVDLLKGILIRCKKLGGSPFMYKLDVQNPDDCKLAAHSFMLEAGGIDCVTSRWYWWR